MTRLESVPVIFQLIVLEFDKQDMQLMLADIGHAPAGAGLPVHVLM